MSLPIKITQVSGKDIEPFIHELAQLRINIFYEWPYIYEGSLEYEKKYLSTYTQNDESFLAIATLNEKIIGASSAVKLSRADTAFSTPLKQAGYNLDEWTYFGESLLMSEYRGQGVGHQFFDLRENWARSMNSKGCLFCSVIRSSDHPLRPAHPRDLEPFWRSRGYSPLEDIVVHYSWPDRNAKQESEKPMKVWIKHLE